MIRTIPVAAEQLGFVAAAPCEPLMVWEDQGGRRVLTDRQERDEHTPQCAHDCTAHTGEPKWNAYVMPAGSNARPEVLQVQVPARQQPVVTQFGAVAFDDLEVRVAIDKGGKLAGYWSARAIRDAATPAARKNGHQGEQHKGEHQPA